jgi:hypothetical protein
VRLGFIFVVAVLTFAGMERCNAEGASMTLQKKVPAGSAFTIRTSGNGEATLYILGLGQVLKRSVQLGNSVPFPAGSLYDAGRYLVILAQGPAVTSDSLDVVPLSAPARLSFLAKPSRLPVSLHDGITGAAYVFDTYGNLILSPMTVSFQLAGPSGVAQKDDVLARDGAALVEMDSTGHQGIDQFTARAGGISSTRVIRQVPGDPCALKMTAAQSGGKLQLKTDPVLDCSGNAVLDGTIVTFTETYDGSQSTADVPLKHGIAQVTMPAYRGAMLTVASGVVLGNQIRWEQ